MTKENGKINTLKDWYQNLPQVTYPKLEVVKHLMRETGKSESCVKKWLLGNNTPSDSRDRELLSQVSGIPVENLFNKVDLRFKANRV